MGNTILIENKNGEMVNAEILLYFTLKDYEDKEYVLYTFNETDEHDLATIYASEVVSSDKGYEFKTIETDDEWLKIKDVMRTSIKKGQEV